MGTLIGERTRSAMNAANNPMNAIVIGNRSKKSGLLKLRSGSKPSVGSEFVDELVHHSNSITFQIGVPPCPMQSLA